MTIKLNCDMGESFGIWKMGQDTEIMPYIDMANLACGFHSSDSSTMNNAVALAKNNDVTIGAHPGYQDLIGFGRRSITCTDDEIQALIIYQLGALSAFCKIHDTKISYLKPHGALYHDMMNKENVFRALLKALSLYDTNIQLMILSSPKNEEYSNIANEYNITLLYEVFADRNYNDDGSLVSRSLKNAVIHDIDDVLQRIKLLKNKQIILSETGKELSLKVDALCVHGDTANALEFIKILRKEISI